MRMQIFQHVPFEGSTAIGRWAEQQDYSIAETHLYARPEYPDVEQFDWLVILGGPMGANDDARYPWLNDEKRLIGEAIQAGKRILGVCLGAQLIAHVLGASVYRNNHREIGWFPITFTDEALGSPLFAGFPKSLQVMHWHGDTFDLPAGYTRIAGSEACLNQGFMSPDGRVIGLQFHMEWDQERAAALVRHCADELQPGPYIQDAAAILAPDAQFTIMNERMFELLDRLAGRA